MYISKKIIIIICSVFSLLLAMAFQNCAKPLDPALSGSSELASEMVTISTDPSIVTVGGEAMIILNLNFPLAKANFILFKNGNIYQETTVTRFYITNIQLTDRYSLIIKNNGQESITAIQLNFAGSATEDSVPACSTNIIDSDGDGFAFENDRVCRIYNRFPIESSGLIEENSAD